MGDNVDAYTDIYTRVGSKSNTEKYYFSDVINGVSELTEYEWHDWVIKNAIGFSDLYPKELTPFSASGIKLDDLPTWNYSVRSFEVCDDYINVVWGYSAKNLNNIFHVQEYRALLVHVVYASLSSSREATY